MGYIIPAIPAVITAAAEKYVGGGVTCLPDATKADGWWMDGFFFVWFGIWVGIAVLSVAGVVVYITAKMGWSALQKQQRLLLYCAVFGYIAVYSIGFSIISQQQKVHHIIIMLKQSIIP